MINRQLLISLALGFLILSYAMVFLSGGQVIILTQEDSIIEWLGALLFLGASLILLCIFFGSKDPSKNLVSKWPWWVLLLGLFFFVSFGEEISWMQRIFGIGTPVALQEYNLQDEMNIHNLKWLHGEYNDGSPKVGVAAFFTAKYLFIYFCLFFFVIIPLLNKLLAPFGEWCQRFRMPILPLWIGGVFLLNLFLAKFFQSVWFSDDPHFKHALVEIMEANFGAISFVEALSLLNSDQIQ
ncbi:MAG: hypothetical protein IPL46_33895 [Saprospiraceae bacterium]|nr:hypothetical protein [Saprospiraceae bacterium]